jgi:hypothetical protein
MTKKFRVGMLVSLVDPAKADVGVGKILSSYDYNGSIGAYDYNGDINVQFPGSEGTGIYRPEELEVVESD